ncbi:MAG: flagellar export protein FliJ [Planctomycetota bacterium]
MSRRFQFRFESLLRRYEQQRDAAGGELAKANEAIVKIESQINTLMAQRDAARKEASRVTAASHVKVDAMLQRGRYDVQLQAEIAQLQQTLAQLHVERDRRQDTLLQQQQEVKRMEQLRERQREEHVLDVKRREQKELDDIVSMRQIMALRSHRSHDAIIKRTES